MTQATPGGKKYSGTFQAKSSQFDAKSDLLKEIYRHLGEGAFDDAFGLLAAAASDGSAGFSRNFIHRVRAEILHEQRRFPEALKCIDQAIAIQKADLYLRLKMSILASAGKSREILGDADFARLLAEQPKDLSTLHAFQRANLLLGRTEDARCFGERQLAVYDDIPARGTVEIPRRLDVQRNPNAIAFSLWGDNPVYCVGAVINCILARKHLPGWQPRFYVDKSVPRSYPAQIERQGGEVLDASQDYPDVPMAFWRFLIADSRSYGFYICRDCDSRLTTKETAAILDWTASGLPFHVIRDHLLHCEPMLAGLWGGHTSVQLDMARRIAAFLDSNRFANTYGNDQKFLREALWPEIKARALNHDSFYKVYDSRPFPGRPSWSEETHVGYCHNRLQDVLAEAASYGIDVP